jgi:hypothetical protein
VCGSLVRPLRSVSRSRGYVSSLAPGQAARLQYDVIVIGGWVLWEACASA